VTTAMSSEKVRDKIKSAVRESATRAPATREQIKKAEKALGQTFPSWLAELYLATDGLTGPTGASFLWPLLKPGTGLVAQNVELRAMLAETDPAGEISPSVVARTIFFGDRGNGSMWGVDSGDPTAVLRWNPRWGDDYETEGDVFEAWAKAQRAFDDADRAIENA
jgi:cell wall assembly regulator SMI1